LTNGKLERVTRAVYPGSFDPPTNGHLDVIERAAECFGELIVAIVVNPQKRTPMFSLQEREDMLKASVTSVGGVRVEHFRGLLADYVKAAEADVIVKGLRVVSDFESEMSAAMMNRSLSDVDTLFLMADQKYSFGAATSPHWSPNPFFA
jgi:pantetheine-phosphate adenylyltransferase